MTENKWVRCTFTLSDEVDDKLKKLQAELMLEVDGTISKATIINGVLEAGLKRTKSDLKESILKHREEREY